jgi:phytoene dehydrogenase-like protein
MNDIIIVGGGLAGLAAATWCAREGLRVQVLERARELGGRATTHVHAGHAINQGGHALYAGGAAARAFAELGVPFAGHAPPTSGGIAIARGALHRLPAGIVSILATDLFGFGAKIEAARALAAIARQDQSRRDDLADVTWRAWVDGLGVRPEVRDVLDAFARVTTYANAPDRASAGATIAQIRRGIDPGVLYLDGGWQTLVSGLERAAERAGATIARGAPVVSIRRDAGALTAVCTGGERIAAHAAIVCTGPAAARSILGDGALGGCLPLHAACLDVGLAELPRPDRLFALGIDRPTYFSVHSASARLAETGATLHVM